MPGDSDIASGGRETWVMWRTLAASAVWGEGA